MSGPFKKDWVGWMPGWQRACCSSLSSLLLSLSHPINSPLCTSPSWLRTSRRRLRWCINRQADFDFEPMSMTRSKRESRGIVRFLYCMFFFFRREIRTTIPFVMVTLQHPWTDGKSRYETIFNTPIILQRFVSLKCASYCLPIRIARWFILRVG